MGGPVWQQSRSNVARDKTTGTRRRECRQCGKGSDIREGKYLATAFLFCLDRRRYRELIFLLKNDYAKQQRNYPKMLTDMYELMVGFEPTRATPVARGINEGLNFRNVVADSEGTWT